MSRKELLFAIGALRAHGCSKEYAEIIAERVLSTPEPGLTAGDLEWLRHIRAAMRLFVSAASPRWTNAN